MPAPKLLAGIAACKGAYGTLAYAALGATKNKVASHALRDQWDKARLQDGDGYIIGKSGTARERTLTKEFYFIGEDVPSTLAAAKTNTKLPDEMFEVITIAGTGLTFEDGTWNYEGGSYDGRVGEYHKCTLEMSQVQKSDGTYGALALVGG
jgi:hypothetical protein